MMRNRDGFTFVELLLVMLIGLVVVGGAYGTLIKQEQGYSQMRAMAGTREDARIGLDLLAAELREVTTDTAAPSAVTEAGIDVLMATPDSIRFRALRKLGLLCDKDKTLKRLIVVPIGADDFAAGDSLLIHVDQDPLLAEDDVWQVEAVSGTSDLTLLSCTTPLGLSLGTLMPGLSELKQLTIPGAGLRFDSVFPGAPIRSFEHLTYRVDTSTGEPMLAMVRNDTIYPIVGPLTATNGLILRYYQADGTELNSSFPLSEADREAIRRIRIVIRAERGSNSSHGPYRDSLFTDVYLRGS